MLKNRRKDVKNFEQLSQNNQIYQKTVEKPPKLYNNSQKLVIKVEKPSKM